MRRIRVITIVLGLVAALLPGSVAVADPPPPAEPEASSDVSTPTWPVATRDRVVAQSETDLWSPPPIHWPAAGVSVVDISASGQRVRATGAPVWVGQASPTRSVSRVRVEVLDRAAAQRAGVPGILLRVSPADAAAGSGPVSLEVDVAGFRGAFGGDWASRLTLVRLPDCALSTPGDAACQTRVPVASARTNPISSRLTAQVDLPGAVPPGAGRLPTDDAAAPGSLFAVAPLAVSGSSDFTKTSLSPAASWRAGTQAGDFSWSYPLRTPPGAGGPVPDLSLGYSSGAVDGRTNAEGAQTSMLGEGWGDLEVGYVERRYRACNDDTANNPAHPSTTTDRCWRLPNATLVLGGRSSELILDDATGKWRPAQDDGSKVELLTGALNGDNNGEHWKVTTVDGVQYFFGLSRLPGWTTGKPETLSAWTVPVFANHSGEPCFSASGFASSWCSQGWRWNLDYVVDTHGNTMSYWYNPAKNKTALAGVIGNTAWYDRGGTLLRVEYGTRSGSELSGSAPVRVVFGYGDRCVTASCWNGGAPITANFPDTPWDLNCQQSPCGTNLTPSFWTALRLSTVTTQVWGGTAYRDVDRWTLTHQFPATGDSTDPSLWLARIDHSGLAGGTVTLPSVFFGGTRYANRTDYNIAGGVPTANKYRITTVDNGTGGQLLVDYDASDCTVTSQANPDNNFKRCFPQWHTPPPGAPPGWTWWNKYRVTSVTERDLVGGSPDVPHTYTYSTSGSSTNVLWHHNDEPWSASIGFRTWSIWRGYSTVTVTDGTPGNQAQTKYLYFRGMDADRTDLGDGTRDAKITDSNGTVVEDADNLAGFLRERITYAAPGGTALTGEIHEPWTQQTAQRVLPDNWAIPGTARSFYTRTGSTRSRVWLAATSSWRITQMTTSFDTTYGMPTQTDDRGDISISTDNVCVKYTYARNTTLWILDTVALTEKLGVPCASTPSYPGDLLSLVKTYYDGATSSSAPPVRGDPTKVQEAASYTTAPIYTTVADYTYDTHGRVLTAEDALSRVTATSYTPATGGPVTGMTVTNPKLHIATTTVDPAWGVPTTVVDPNGKTTTASYDPLGRLLKVWRPGRPLNQTPDVEYTYNVRSTAASSVTTKLLSPNNTQIVSHEIVDGWLRPRQSQTPPAQALGGRLVTDTAYDSRGLGVKESTLRDAVSVPTDTLVTFADTAVPRQIKHLYDGIGRETDNILLGLNVEQWRTTMEYDGDRTLVTPPAGGTGTTSIVDALGRSVELRQHHGGLPSGSYDSTVYAYDRAGRLTSVTDPAGNDWTYTFDLRGRTIQTVDPDKGTTNLTYDIGNQLETTTDARGVTLFRTYDDLGRPVGLYRTDINGQKLAAWTYDTLAKGQLTSSKRFSSGASGPAYTTAVTAYDDGYRPLGISQTFPSTEGTLAGTWTTTMTYKIDGSLATTSYPAAGGQAAETVSYGYDNTGRPLTMTGLSTYISDTDYRDLGELHRQFLGGGNARGQVTFGYGSASRRLLTVQLHTERPGTPGTFDPRWEAVSSRDPAGNVTKIDEKLGGVAVSTQCFDTDHLTRLTQAWTNAAADCATAPASVINRGPDPYWTGYTYNTVGNRLTETLHGLGGAGDTLRTYSYPAAGAARPHALTQVVSTGAVTGTDTYSYDSAGNTLTRNVGGTSQTLTWDDEGHLATHTVNGQTTSYRYDASGNRLLRTNPDGSAVAYLPGGWELARGTSGQLTCTRYYGQHGRTVAVRGATGVSWLSGDMHGTATVTIDPATLGVTTRRSTPFGAPRGPQPAWPTDKGFVGGTTDPTGLTHLGAREYDPTIGRFISVDPVQDLSDPQQWNGYAYANNNPVTRSDPSGLLPSVCLDECGSNDDRDYQQHIVQGKNWVKPGRQPCPKALKAECEPPLDDHEDEALQLIDSVYLPSSMTRQMQWAVFFEFWKNFEHNYCNADVGCFYDDVDVYNMAYTVCLNHGCHKQLGISIELLAAMIITQVGWNGGPGLARGRHGAGPGRWRPTGCRNSFVPGTKVLLADGSTKPIEEVDIGDVVLATDPETGRTEPREVTDTIVGHGEKLLIVITVDTDGEAGDQVAVVTATDGHPFWMPSGNQWVNATDLVSGDKLLSPTGAMIEVIDVTHRAEIATVYNLTVAELHTYYVLANRSPVLVHNLSRCQGDRWTSDDNLNQHYDKHGDEMGYETKSEYDHAARDLMCVCGGRRPGVLIKQEGFVHYYFDPRSGEFGMTTDRGIVTFFKADQNYFNQQPGALVP